MNKKTSIYRIVISMILAFAMTMNLSVTGFSINYSDRETDGKWTHRHTYVMTDTNNLRQSKSTSSAILAKIPANTHVVDLKGDEGNWLYVHYKDKYGYIHKNFAALNIVAAYSFCVASKSTKMYMSSKLVGEVVDIPVGSAIWFTGEALVNQNGVEVIPGNITIGTKSYWGFVNPAYFSEVCNYYANVKRTTKMYKSDTGNSYYKVIQSGTYYVTDFSGNRVEILRKNGNKMEVAYLSKIDVDLKYIPPVY